jgi:hypothetical protein
MEINLKEILEVASILFDKKYTLERTYTREDDNVIIKYTIKEDYEKLITTYVTGSYNIFYDLVDYINRLTLKAFQNAINTDR